MMKPGNELYNTIKQKYVGHQIIGTTLEHIPLRQHMTNKFTFSLISFYR